MCCKVALNLFVVCSVLEILVKKAYHISGFISHKSFIQTAKYFFSPKIREAHSDKQPNLMSSTCKIQKGKMMQHTHKYAVFSKFRWFCVCDLAHDG